LLRWAPRARKTRNTFAELQRRSRSSATNRCHRPSAGTSVGTRKNPLCLVTGAKSAACIRKSSRCGYKVW
jgi:hypothetical protein